MELMPALHMGWMNGWILLVIDFMIQGGLMLIFPKEVVARLFDRSGWSKKQQVYTRTGKVFSLACLILIILTPLKIGTPVFFVGLILYAIGLAGLVVAMFNYKDTPLDQPVTKGMYRISRHPQVVSVSIVILGTCLAIGSWAALAMLLLSRFFQHLGILAEEEACLQRYGEPYREYLERVPRYLVLK